MLNAEAHFIIHHSLGASCSIQDAWDWSQSGYPKKNSDHLCRERFGAAVS